MMGQISSQKLFEGRRHRGSPKKLKVSREAIYAIGDSSNDIEMLQYAHVGIAMGNGKEEVKRVSDYITDDIAEDGLYNALKHFNLIIVIK